MNAEIIAVGSELLTPQRMDTNSLFLTAELNGLGVEVVRKSIVGDDRERLAEAVRAAMASAGIVILTGGLGPTEDDVTRDAVAQALGRELLFSQEICDGIEARFARMNRRMAEINKRQAWIIEGAEALTNPNGTAPGLYLEHNGVTLLLLPGPPRELKPMFAAECLPRLAAKLPQLVIRTRFLRVAGMPESDLDQLIAPVYTKYTNPATTILAAAGDIQVHLRARCETAEEADQLLAEVSEPIEQLLGDRIYSRNGDPLEATVGALLKERGLTLTVAESCTGGMLGERITNAPGASAYFLGGILTYTDQMKQKLLGVPQEALAAHTAVSAPAAEAMAAGARRLTGASVALSVTGLAGPDGGTEQTPVGLVFIGYADENGESSRRFQFVGDRHRIRTLAAQSALDMLRRRLTESAS